MKKTEEYKGHHITAEASKIGRHIRWSYQIDGGELRESRGKPLRTEELMLSEAISEARWAIDRMK